MIDFFCRIKFLPGAPKVLSGKFAGLLATVASFQKVLPEVAFIQSQMSLSKRHSPTLTTALGGAAAKKCVEIRKLLLFPP